MPGDPYVTLDNLLLRAAGWLGAVAPYARRRLLPSLGRAALLVVDVQRFFAEPGSHAHLPALEAVLPNILTLAAAFRRAGRPVVCTRHGSAAPGEGAETGAVNPMHAWWRDVVRRGEPRHRLVEALARTGPDRVLDKERYSAFEGTDLARWLADRGCDAVVVCGVMTHLCVESSVRDAFSRGLGVVVAADGCASKDEELHLGALRALAHGFAVVRSTEEVAGCLADMPALDPGEDPPDAGGGPGPGTAAPLGSAALEVPSGSVSLPLAVVGAGPAGLAAAVLAHRAGLSPLLLCDQGQGGLARTAGWIENYPGFPGGIAGDELMARFTRQARDLGVRLARCRVERLDHDGAGFSLLLDRPPGVVSARAVILATGTAPRRLPDPPLPDDARVVYRTDALASVTGSAILVVGGGEAALDQAIRVRRLGAARVQVALRAARPRAMELLRRRAEELGVEVLPCTRVTGVDAAGPALPLTVRLVTGETAADGRPSLQEERTVQVDGLVICVGREPRLPLLPAGLARVGAEQPRCDELGRTSLPGLYLAGDVRRGVFRQVAIAVGDGVAAAMDAVRYLGGGAWR